MLENLILGIDSIYLIIGFQVFQVYHNDTLYHYDTPELLCHLSDKTL